MTANLTRSRGIALIAGLMLMAAMVILALAVATGVLLERKMAGNFGDAQLALARAKLASSWGEYWLYGQVVNPLGTDCESGCEEPLIYRQGTLPGFPELEDSDWWSVHARIAGVSPATDEVHLDYSLPNMEDARWLIEEVHSQPLNDPFRASESEDSMLAYYRVLARGTGRSPGSIAVTESIIARPWIDSVVPSPFPPVPGSDWLCEPVSTEISCGRQAWRRLR